MLGCLIEDPMTKTYGAPAKQDLTPANTSEHECPCLRVSEALRPIEYDAAQGGQIVIPSQPALEPFEDRDAPPRARMQLFEETDVIPVVLHSLSPVVKGRRVRVHRQTAQCGA